MIEEESENNRIVRVEVKISTPLDLLYQPLDSARDLALRGVEGCIYHFERSREMDSDMLHSARISEVKISTPLDLLHRPLDSARGLCIPFYLKLDISILRWKEEHSS
jgi:hypothetical protein